MGVVRDQWRQLLSYKQALRRLLGRLALVFIAAVLIDAVVMVAIYSGNGDSRAYDYSLKTRKATDGRRSRWLRRRAERTAQCDQRDR